MPPRSNYVPASSLGIVAPKTRGSKLSNDIWLQERNEIDGAEGLWRIHDGLYDLSKFIEKHPGGSEWLELTKGTDITEAFEVHHISNIPEEMVKKFFVKKARTKRNYPFTFEEDGFYKTLKRELRPIINTLPKQSVNNTNFFCDAMVFLLFFLATLSTFYWNFWLATLAGLLLGMLTIATHNYLHMKDNYRMYYFQFSMLQVRDWRISHVLSHHLYANTITDLEIALFEPLLLYLPANKSKYERIRAVCIAPILWLGFFHLPLLKRLLSAHECNYKNVKLSDLTGLTLPLFMYIFGNQSLWSVFLMWNFILVVGGFYLGFIGQNGAHHHPDIFHDGDTPRSKDNYDWGLSQLDSIMDHKEVCGSHFLVLIHFGDHCLHHLFPTLDHGSLEHLYPVFEEVLEKFDANLRFVTQWETICGNFRQLTKVKPNPNPPELHKYGTRVRD